MEPVIEFRCVQKRYHMAPHLRGGLKDFALHLPSAIRQIRASSYLALDDISFSVAAGETLGVIGRNGAGKSTLLGLTAGVMAPSSGDVLVHRRPYPLLDLGAGFHPDLTAPENIVLNGMLLGATRAAIRSRIDEVLDFAELTEFDRQPLRTFSNGMLARLGFGVLAHLEPDLLLIDEVLAVGDLAFQKKCYDAMRAFQVRGCTIFLVSHNLEDINRLCHRVLWIERGGIRMQGPAEAVTEAYRASVLEKSLPEARPGPLTD